MSNSSLRSGQRVVLFPEGPGFVFVSILAKTGSSKVLLVRSIADGRLYVRKESMPSSSTTQYSIQNKDVRVVHQIQGFPGAPGLVGWTEYLDDSTSYVVNVSYWQLCNGGTLANLLRRVRDNQRLLPEKCLWSIFGQMLRIMLDTISIGILHYDSHTENWFIHVASDSVMPRIILGDWGRVEFKPAADADKNTTDTWWNLAHHQLTIYLVMLIRELMLGGKPVQGSTKEHFNRVLDACKQDHWKRDPEQLINRLNIIEDYPPSSFSSKEEWLASLERMYQGILNTQRELNQSIMHGNARPSTHNKIKYTYDSTIPPFNEALSKLDELDGDSIDRGRDLNQLIHLWKVANVDPTTNEIISIAQRPTQYPSNNYKDETGRNQLPTSWLQAHDETQRMARQWGAEDQAMGHDLGYGLQDQSIITQRYDTAF